MPQRERSLPGSIGIQMNSVRGVQSLQKGDLKRREFNPTTHTHSSTGALPTAATSVLRGSTSWRCGADLPKIGSIGYDFGVTAVERLAFALRGTLVRDRACLRGKRRRYSRDWI